MSDGLKKKLKKVIGHNRAASLVRTCLMRSGAAGRHAKGRKRQVWAFNAGDYFTGNPKWLFIYVNRFRPDIFAYWICDRIQTVRYVRSLGYHACTYGSAQGIYRQAGTDVFCVEAVKEKISAYFPKDVVYLNLFHGVGCKPIEKKLRFGYLVEPVAAKYIRYNGFLQRNMLFLVTSELMEKHFAGQLDLREEMIIRGGYPRCIYQKLYEPVATFDHDLIGARHLPEDTRIAVYAPTFRDDPDFDFWGQAIPDMEALIRVLEREHILFVFKIHPHMERDTACRKLKADFEGCPWIMFWDNRYDIYEIFQKIDLGIIDYSSIFYDMLAGGVRHFIRYFFDLDGTQSMRDLVFDVREMTCGTICRDFSSLLRTLGCYEQEDQADRERIMNLFWSYADEGTMNRIVDTALRYRPDPDLKMPVLYSFSVYGTLLPDGKREAADLKQNIDRLESLIRSGQTVILICDRHQPEKTVREALAKVSAQAAALPLYQPLPGEGSEEKKQLFLRAYLSFDTYQFEKWIHCGSDPETDGSVPAKLGIITCQSR